MGELGGVDSPARIYSPLVGAEATCWPGADARLPLRPDWEYAVLALAGEPESTGWPSPPDRCCTSGSAGPSSRCAPPAPPGCCSSAASPSPSTW